ncbi:MAG TPA: hypothetical protein PKK82_03330 [Anaerolineaceae bacterium]|nr:hypothetical protein [Anaerolineaceae bacterium]
MLPENINLFKYIETHSSVSLRSPAPLVKLRQASPDRLSRHAGWVERPEKLFDPHLSERNPIHPGQREFSEHVQTSFLVSLRSPFFPKGKPDIKLKDSHFV